MRWVKKDKDGKVEMASEIQFDESFELADEDYDVGFDGRLYSASELLSADYLQKKEAFDKNIQLKRLRHLRETECFSVINRGELWYQRLTLDQKTELAAWYQAWLDAPQTGIVPQNLNWIKK